MSQPRGRSGTPIFSMVVSLIVVVIGLGALNQGIFELSNNNVEGSLVYLSVTVFSFFFVALSILRVRRGFAIPYMQPNKVMSIVQCAQCTFKQIRNFAVGDYVFKMVGNCTQCGRPSLMINAIYGEEVKKK